MNLILLGAGVLVAVILLALMQKLVRRKMRWYTVVCQKWKHAVPIRPGSRFKHVTKARSYHLTRKDCDAFVEETTQKDDEEEWLPKGRPFLETVGEGTYEILQSGGSFLQEDGMSQVERNEAERWERLRNSGL